MWLHTTVLADSASCELNLVACAEADQYGPA
jgi:hypothetical protein